jgi:hypothetical protein
VATITLEEVRTVGGYVVWVLGACWALAWCHGVRTYLRQRGEVERPTLNEAMLACVAVLLIPVLRISPYHLFWMLPLAKLIGILTALFPRALLLLYFPAWVFERPFLIGLSSCEILRIVVKPSAKSNLGVYFSSRAARLSHVEALRRMVETRYPLSASNRDAVLPWYENPKSTAPDLAAEASEAEQACGLVHAIFTHESHADFLGPAENAAVWEAIIEAYDEVAATQPAALREAIGRHPQASTPVEP